MQCSETSLQFLNKKSSFIERLSLLFSSELELNGKDIAVVIAALGTLGIPIILVLVTVGSVLTGFVLWSLLSFLSAWMVPLIFAGIAALILIEFAPRGPTEALIGVVSAVVLVLVGYVVWAGVLSGPQNTYSLLLSVSGASAPVALPDIAMFVVAIVLAITGLGYIVLREYD